VGVAVGFRQMSTTSVDSATTTDDTSQRQGDPCKSRARFLGRDCSELAFFVLRLLRLRLRLAGSMGSSDLEQFDGSSGTNQRPQARMRRLRCGHPCDARWGGVHSGANCGGFRGGALGLPASNCEGHARPCRTRETKELHMDTTWASKSAAALPLVLVCCPLLPHCDRAVAMRGCGKAVDGPERKHEGCTQGKDVCCNADAPQQRSRRDPFST
jgi:hypothetical protein